MGSLFYRRVDPTLCQAQVWPAGAWHGYPCCRHGMVRIRGRWLCKQHGKRLVEIVMWKEVGTAEPELHQG
jgi:hypothetical protein